MLGFDVSESMSAMRAMWARHGARMMSGAYAVPVSEDRTPVNDAELRAIAADWDNGARSLNEVRRKYGRGQPTIEKAVQLYSKRPIVKGVRVNQKPDEVYRAAARAWDDGAPTVAFLCRQFNIKRRTAHRAIRKYATRALAVKTPAEACAIGNATRRAKAGRIALQFPVAPVCGS